MRKNKPYFHFVAHWPPERLRFRFVRTDAVKSVDHLRLALFYHLQKSSVLFSRYFTGGFSSGKPSLTHLLLNVIHSFNRLAENNENCSPFSEFYS